MQVLSYIHGAIYTVAGLWPVMHMRSFARVTGRAGDAWAGRAAGMLMAVIGLIILRAGRTGFISQEIILLAVLSCISLAIVDVVCVWTGRVPAVYLADAWVEAVLALSWTILAMPHMRM